MTQNNRTDRDKDNSDKTAGRNNPQGNNPGQGTNQPGQPNQQPGKQQSGAQPGSQPGQDKRNNPDKQSTDKTSKDPARGTNR